MVNVKIPNSNISRKKKSILKSKSNKTNKVAKLKIKICKDFNWMISIWMTSWMMISEFFIFALLYKLIGFFMLKTSTFCLFSL